jgi:competence ComEA-like helix-hairpin-helix protein
MTGLDSLSLASLKQYAQIFPDELLKKLNINQIELEELAKHPYLTRRKAKAIINFRTQHGAYQDIDELTSVRVLTDKELEKIRPYLATE